VRVSERNNSFRTITAVVTVREVPDELVAGIHRQASPRDATTNSPRHLAERVLGFVTARVNRIISYARNVKGQYWLTDIEYDPYNLNMALNTYGSQIKVGGSQWLKWNPAPSGLVTHDGRHVDPAWCINRGDWAEARNFVAASGHPPLVGHLLAEAEWHAEQGHLRVALTEGVAALEAAVDAFAASPAGRQCFESLLSARIRVQSFPRLVDKFGFRGTLDVLFPIIFSEGALPMELLTECVAAVDKRGMVIHHGQRSLDANTVQRYVASLRRMCGFLKGRQAQPLEA